MSTVVAMQVRPKTVQVKHRKHDIILTFIPATATTKASWHWEAIIIRRYEFEGETESEQGAMAAAKSKIDTFAEH
jgi:hypothetical protein